MKKELDPETIKGVGGSGGKKTLVPGLAPATGSNVPLLVLLPAVGRQGANENPWGGSLGWGGDVEEDMILGGPEPDSGEETSGSA